MYPILGQFQNMTLYTYGTAMFIALVLIYFLAIRRLDTTLLQRTHLDDLGLIIMFSIWIGGGLVAILFSQSHDLTHLNDLFRYGKLQQVGTLSISLSVFILLALYCRWKKLPLIPVLDFLMPLFILGYAVQRTLGCFSAGCCYGQPTDLFWAVRFPDTFGVGPAIGINVHPTQLYLGGTALLTYLIMRHWQKKQPPPGSITSIGLVGLFGFYFLIAFVRGDMQQTRQIAHVPINQLFAGLICIAGIITLTWIRQHQRRTQATTAR